MSSVGNRDSSVPASFEYQTVHEVLPLFDSFMPGRSAEIRARLDQLAVDAPRERESADASDRPDTVEELLSKADTAPSTLRRDRLYYQAAMLASHQGATDRALSIAEKLSNEQDRFVAKSLILYRAAEQAFSKKDVDRAYRVAQDLPDLQLRARVLSRVVSALHNEKDTTRATEVLTEAVQRFSKVENTAEKALAMLIMTEAATVVDPLIHGFEAMRSTVATINRANFDSPQSSTGVTNAERSGSVSPRKIDIKLDTLDFEKSFPLLARTDFDQALLLAKSLEKKEASALAQLAVCRWILVGAQELRSENKGKSPEPQKQKKPVERKPSVKQKGNVQDR